MRHKWDFFIAHAGGDTNIAENLYVLLISGSKVFLDSKSLILGDDWDLKLPEAQRLSLITVVIVSPKTESAYYQREEIAAAIQMARSDNLKHRVIPIFMPGYDRVKVPYGLTLKHSITLGSETEMGIATERLLDALQKVRQQRKNTNRAFNSNTTDYSESVLQILNETKRVLKNQLVAFAQPKIVPLDCDDFTQKLITIQASFSRTFVDNPSKLIANQFVALFNLEEEISIIMDSLSQFRRICLQMDKESDNLKHQVVENINNAIKDIDGILVKREG